MKKDEYSKYYFTEEQAQKIMAENNGRELRHFLPEQNEQKESDVKKETPQADGDKVSK